MQTTALFWAFPLLMVALSIGMQGGLLSGNANASVNFCNQNCAPPGSVTIITCNGSSPSTLPPVFTGANGGCKIANTCITPTPAPAWCAPFPLNFLFPGTFLWSGDTVVLSATQVNQGVTTTAATFFFTSIGPTGWIVLILIGVAVAVVAGLQIFSSGLGPEAVHILWISGISLGIWVVLSAFDGFLTGNPNSLFGYLNGIVINGFSGQLGTGLWVMCTLLWTLGILGLVSRGN